MTEYEFALSLKSEYEEAKKEFSTLAVVRNFSNITNELKLDFSKLKLEVEKLGYKIELAKNLNKYWKNQWDKNPIIVFYLNPSDIS